MRILTAVATSLLLVEDVASRFATADNVARLEFMQAMQAARPRLNPEEDIGFSTKLWNMATPVQRRRVEENQQQQDGQNDDSVEKYGINLKNYAFKYIGCQNIHTFSDELADDRDASTVLEMNRFVVFRFCKRDECSNYNKYGCNADFGDYLIKMEDYLQAMSEYYFASYQEYCETCFYCMKQRQYNYNNNAAAGDDAVADDAVADDAAGDDYAAGDDAAGDDGNRRLNYYNYNYDDGNYVNYANDDAYANANDDGNYANGDDAAVGDDAAGDDAYEGEENVADDQESCDAFYNVCDQFRSACKDYTAKASGLDEYFQCAENNAIGYLGPHCRSDGITIGIGIYGDEDCNGYLGDLGDIGSKYGIDVADSYLKPYYSTNCVSCLTSESYDLYTDDNEGNTVTDICGALYQGSAKCNLHMGDDNELSYSQEQTETSVCNFITSLLTNSYDEYGEIFVDADQYTWMAYLPTLSSMTKFQKWAMSFSVLLIVGLAVYSCYLHRVLKKQRLTWVPRNSRPGRETRVPGAPVSRMQSGIISGRSRSNQSYQLSGGLLA